MPRPRSRRTVAALALTAVVAGGVVLSQPPAPAFADTGATSCGRLLQDYSVEGSTVTIPTRAIAWDDSGNYTRYQLAGRTVDDRDGDVVLTNVPAGVHDLRVQRVVYNGQTPEQILYDAVQAIAVEPARISGADRFETSAALDALVGDGCGTVYLASGENFPDALAGVPAAGQYAQMLLTRGDHLPAQTLERLHAIDPDRIVLLGGPTTISTAVEAQLESLDWQVERIAGADRYDTSMLVAEQTQWNWGCSYEGGFEDCGPMPATGAIVVTGDRFPDAVSAGSVAAALRIPVILVPGGADSLDPAFMARLDAQINGEVAILGSASSVSEGIEASLRSSGFPVTRLAGADRYETNVLAIRYGMQHGMDSTAGLDFVATGQNFPDALTAGVLASTTRGASAVYLSPQGCTLPVTASLMAERDATARVLVGGTPSLADGVLSTTCR